MAFKIFNIGKANARIEELEAENAQLKQQIQAAADSTPEALTQMGKELEANSAKLAQAEKDLATAKASIASLTSEKESATAKAAQLEKDLVEKGKEVEIKAAKQAAEIQASIGAPAAPTAPKSETKPAAELTGMARLRAHAREELKAGGYVPKN